MKELFEKTRYNDLSKLSIGRIGEYLTKLVLTLHNLDVYTSEVDDKGLDFVVRTLKGNYFDIQVKSARLSTNKYVFIKKAGIWGKDSLRDNLYLSLVLFKENETPELFLIPSTAWKKESDLLRPRNGEAGNKPEWGINLSLKNLHLLEEFNYEKQVLKIISN